MDRHRFKPRQSFCQNMVWKSDETIKQQYEAIREGYGFLTILNTQS